MENKCEETILVEGVVVKVPQAIKVPKTVKQKNDNHYVDNEMLRVEIIKSKTRRSLTPNATEMLILMVDHIQSSFTYRNQADKQDCRSSAIEVVLNNWSGCDVLKEKPFAWFTRMIYNGLYAGWNHIRAERKNTISLDAIFRESV